MTDAPTRADLEAEAESLILPEFTEATALALGTVLVNLARASSLPVVIDIRSADRTFFPRRPAGLCAPERPLGAAQIGNRAALSRGLPAGRHQAPRKGRKPC